MQPGTPAAFLAAAAAQQAMGFAGHKLGQHPGPQQPQPQQPSAPLLPLANRASVHAQVRR